MKTILAYGDSLTWGSCPESGARHGKAFRWPDVVAQSLGKGAEVITDAMRGRTTAYDEYLADCDRNGARLLPSILYSHAPIDIVVLLLGANDMKPHICGTALGAKQGMRRLVQIAKNHSQGLADRISPQILIVAPPPLVDTLNIEMAEMFAGGVSESKKLCRHYADLAQEMNVAFFDAGAIAEASSLDGVHLDAVNTQNIGHALAPIISNMIAA